MKDRAERKNTEKILLITAAILFMLLCVLTVATISVISNSSSVQSSVPFDLDRITADKNAEYSDVSGTLLPSFIGITADGVRQGVSASANTVAELYRMITPLLASVIADEYATLGDDSLWSSLAEKENSVYIRYHHELPDHVISIFADSGNTVRNSLNSYIYELILLPYSESTDTVTVAARSQNGSVCVYEQSSPEEIITDEDLRRVLRSYRSGLTEFSFIDETISAESPTEPVFLDSVSTRNIIITGQSGALIQNSSEDIEALMRLFTLNPDKLLNRHTESDGSTSYIDTQGILYLRNSTFEYTATAEGGISLGNYIGYSDSMELMDYIQAAMSIFNDIRALNRNYTGGDADITLASVEVSGGNVKLTYEYTFDNLRIVDIEPAFIIEFENGMLRSARLYTIAVRNLGDKAESIEEWWFVDYISKCMTEPLISSGLVYRSDFRSESVKAEWCADVSAAIP